MEVKRTWYIQVFPARTTLYNCKCKRGDRHKNQNPNYITSNKIFREIENEWNNLWCHFIWFRESFWHLQSHKENEILMLLWCIFLARKKNANTSNTYQVKIRHLIYSPILWHWCPGWGAFLWPFSYWWNWLRGWNIDYSQFAFIYLVPRLFVELIHIR